VILIIIFLSQSGHFNAQGQQVQQKTAGYWDQAVEWVKINIYPRVSSEFQNRGGELVEHADTIKNNFAQNIWDEIKNYLQKNFNYLFKTTVE